jgi:hypothetical protein
MSQPKAEFDTPWKKILDIYFEDFVSYCWPERHAEINWQEGYKSLDKELSKIARDAPITNRIIDKLMEVYLKNGESAYVLIHLEVQGQFDSHFEERMFIYYCRLNDLHKKPIASLAILVDADEDWRPGSYKKELWGSSIEMRFPIIKIIDYKSRIRELESSSNPFASVILAQLATLEKQSPEARLISKINLIKWLYTRGWKREDVLTLLTFMDWVFVLPKQLELKCKEAIAILEEELHVDYVTSFERMGIEKGLQEGIQQGLQEGMQQGVQQGESALLLRQLKHKFMSIPEAYKHKIEQADAKSLLKWGERILDVNSLEEVFKD